MLLNKCFKWLVLSIKLFCKWKSNNTIICYVYVGQSYVCTSVSKVTRNSGYRKHVAFEVYVAWTCLSPLVFVLSWNMFISVSYKLELCMCFFFLFSVNMLAWVWSAPTGVAVVSQALEMLLAGYTVCGFCSWSCCSKSGACYPNHQPPPPHQLTPGFLLSFSWAPVPGLWPVDECYILAVSTGVSWGLVCGGSSVSGSVCQLLVPLPPAPQCWLGCSQWHKHTVTDSVSFENESIALRIGIFIAVPMKRGLFKALKCSGVVFLNRPQNLWQIVYSIS